MHILTYGVAADKLGGIETFLFNMNKFMVNNTVFDYVIEGNETIHQDTINRLNGKIYYIPSKRRAIGNIFAWCRLLKELKGKINCIYFNLYSMAWFIPIILSVLYGYKVFVHAHNNNLHDCGIIQRLLHIIGRFIQRFLRINRLTNSPASAKFFFGSKSAEMIYNAVDINKFRFNNDARINNRKKLNVNENQHIYGFVGRIAYQKNPFFLVDIFSKIKEIDDKAIFLICGEGELKDEVDIYAKKLNLNIKFIGNVNNIQDYYHAMDLFLLPSRFEGLGIVLIEAQTSGLPCVTSADVVPIEAKVSDLLTYYPLDKNAEQWARLCCDLVKQTDNARNKYYEIIKNSNFSIDKEAPRLEKILIN
jgi:glycosyltransferase involved in cell wall biosynthesis